MDALIFSSLAYIQYGGKVEAQPDVPVLLRDAAESYFLLEDHEDRVRVKNDLELLRRAALTTLVVALGIAGGIVIASVVSLLVRPHKPSGKGC